MSNQVRIYVLQEEHVNQVEVHTLVHDFTMQHCEQRKRFAFLIKYVDG